MYVGLQRPSVLGITIANSAPPAPGSTSSSPSPTDDGLQLLAKAAGKLCLCSATDNPELSDTTYIAKLDDYKEFGQITPVGSTKWVGLSLLIRAACKPNKAWWRRDRQPGQAERATTLRTQNGTTKRSFHRC
ncbi:hypothetical protein BD414DRAFT_493330 [Trametes punicea]|nr:hypothetical protein BD414DRAFT_493330 [Trametes punicea]